MKKKISNLMTAVRKYISCIVTPFTKKERTSFRKLPMTLRIAQCVVAGIFLLSYGLLSACAYVDNFPMEVHLLHILPITLLVTTPPLVQGVVRKVCEVHRYRNSINGCYDALYNAIQEWLDNEEPISYEEHRYTYLIMTTRPTNEEEWDEYERQVGVLMAYARENETHTTKRAKKVLRLRMNVLRRMDLFKC